MSYQIVFPTILGAKLALFQIIRARIYLVRWFLCQFHKIWAVYLIKWNKLGQLHKGWYGLIFTKFEKVPRVLIIHFSENGVVGVNFMPNKVSPDVFHNLVPAPPPPPTKSFKN